jgi:hypothetical protein
VIEPLNLSERALYLSDAATLNLDFQSLKNAKALSGSIVASEGIVIMHVICEVEPHQRATSSVFYLRFLSFLPIPILHTCLCGLAALGNCVLT